MKEIKSGRAVRRGKKSGVAIVITLILSLVLSACTAASVGGLKARTDAKAAGENDNMRILNSVVYEYMGSAQPYNFLAGKAYMIEAWGAEGGFLARTNEQYSLFGGLGGYTRGYYNATANKTGYVYVGQHPEANRTPAWNGGGTGFSNGSSGGGASDVRFVKADASAATPANANGARDASWYTSSTTPADPSLISRILVAGGGGGTGETFLSRNVNGTTGANFNTLVENGGDGGGEVGQQGQPQTQKTSTWSNIVHYAGFGGTKNAGGDGGCWTGIYGENGVFGKGGNATNGIGGGGGGGWYGGGGSYAVGGGGGSSYAKPDVINASVLAQGVNRGNGKVIIHTLSVPTVKDSQSQVFYYNGDRNLKDGVLQNPKANPDLFRTGTGSAQAATLQSGQYQFETWGAAGGDSAYNTNNRGGRGGYAKGNYNVQTPGTIANIFVGGQGYDYNDATGNMHTLVNGVRNPGGYNGGGQGSTVNASIGSGGGGGTDIRISATAPTSALPNNVWNANYNQRVIVAGGGGGTEQSVLNNSGGGGGELGTSCTSTGTAGGGTQTAGGQGGALGTVPAGAGALGKGGDVSSIDDGSGGGGGLFGGGASATAGAAGGSGYIGGAAAANAGAARQGLTAGETYAGDQQVTFSSNTVDAVGNLVAGGTKTCTINRGTGGQGFVVITKISPDATYHNPTISTISRDVSTAVAGATLGNQSGTALTFSNRDIYIDGGNANYVTVSNGVNGNYFTTSLGVGNASLNVKANFALSSEKAFYALMQDSPGNKYYVPFKVKTTNAAAAEKTTKSADFNVGKSTTQSSDSLNDNSIYSPSAIGTFTYFRRNPVSGLSNDFTVNASDLYNDTDAADTVLFSIQSVNTAIGAAVGYSITPGTNYMGLGYESITIKGLAGNISGSTYKELKFNIVNVEKAGGHPNPTNAADGNSDCIMLDTSRTNHWLWNKVLPASVVFRQDNIRPNYSADPKGTINPKADTHVVLDASNKAGTTVNLSSLVTDPSDQKSLRITSVVVPKGEFIPLDKYGAKIEYAAGSAFSMYGLTQLDGTNTKELTAQGDTNKIPTGFSDTLLSAVANGSTTNGSFVNYTINGAENGSITFYGVMATRDFYSGRRDRSETTKLGDFYVLVQVSDPGEATDKGIWFPIAITVNDSATTQASRQNIIMGADDTTTKIISPLQTTEAKFGVYATDKNNIPDVSLAKNHANLTVIVEDADNKYLASKNTNHYTKPINNPTFIEHTGVNAISYTNNNLELKKQGTQLSYSLASRNEYNSSASKDESILARGAESNFGLFFEVEFVKLYVARSLFNGLTNIVDGSNMTEYNWLTSKGYIIDDGQLTDKATSHVDSEGNTVSGGNRVVAIWGLKITPKKFSQFKFVEIDIETVSSRVARTDAAAGAKLTANAYIGINNAIASSKLLGESTFGDTFRNTAKPTVSQVIRDGVTMDNITLFLNVGSKKNLEISPYDLVKDNDIFTVDKTSSNPKDAHYTEFLANMNKSYNVRVAEGEVVTNSTIQPVTLDKLKFDSVTDTGREDIATIGKSENGDKLTVTAKTRTADGAATAVITVKDNDNKEIKFLLSVIVKNSPPKLNSFIIGYENGNAIYSDNNIFYLSATGAKGNNSTTEDKDSFGKWTSTAFNVREFLTSELITDDDTSDTTSNRMYIASDSFKQMTKNASGEYVDIPAGKEFISVTYGSGSGIRSTSSSVVKVKGLSSTQGLPYGLFLRFIANDGQGDESEAELFIQFEVLDSNPEVTKENITYAKDAIAFDKDRYLVHNEELGAKLTGGNTNRYTVITRDNDAYQTVVPFANGTNDLNQPAVSAKKFGLPGLNDAVWVEKSPFKADQLNKDFSYDKNGTAVNLIDLLYFKRDADRTPVVPHSFDEAQNYDFAIRIDMTRSFLGNTEGTLDIGFNFASSNQIIDTASDIKAGGKTKGLDGYEGIRDGRAVAVGKMINTTIRVSMSEGTIENNFTKYTTHDNYYGVYLTDGENGFEKQTNPEFKYSPIEVLADDTDVAFTAVPLSYFALPSVLTVDGTAMTSSVGYATTKNNETTWNSSNITSDVTQSIFESIAISDGSKTWSGSALLDNPYVKIESAGLTNADKLVNKDRTVFVAGAEGNPATAVKQTKILAEDQVGLKLMKKGIRTTGENVTITLKLKLWKGSNGVFTTSTPTTTDVTVPLIVKNSPMSISKGDNSVIKDDAVTGDKNVVTVSAKTGSSNHVVYLANNTYDTLAPDPTVSQYRVAVNDNDNIGKRTGNESNTGTYYTTYRDRANFFTESVHSLKSVSEYNKFTDAQRDALSKFYNSNKLKGTFTQYFNAYNSNANLAGSADKILFNINDANYNPNYGYENFFSISQLDASTNSLSIVPNRKTNLDIGALRTYGAEVIAGTKTDYNVAKGYAPKPSAEIPVNANDANYVKLVDEHARMFNLRFNGTNFYFPLRVLVYDTFNGSNYETASFDSMQINVFIANSEPALNTNAMPDGSPNITMNLKVGDDTVGSRNVASVITDKDMRLDTSGTLNYMNKEDIGKLAEKVPTGVPTDSQKQTAILDALTSDYVNEITLVSASYGGVAGTAVDGHKAVEAVVNSDLTNIKFTAYFRDTVLGGTEPHLTIKYNFKDNHGGSGIDVTFKIFVSNSAPTIDNSTLEIETQNSGNNAKDFIKSAAAIAGGQITMRAGDTFNLYTTNFANFNRKPGSVVYGKQGGEPVANFKHGTAADGGAGYGNLIYDYKQVSGFDTRSVHLGNLAVFNDDTPWALRFSSDVTIGNSSTRNNMDYKPGNSFKAEVNGMDGNFATALHFTAKGAVNNMPITVTAFDESKSSVRSYTFYVTIVSSPPTYVTGDGLRSDLKAITNVGNTEYVTHMAIGETREFELTNFAIDADLGDNDNLYFGSYSNSSDDVFAFNGDIANPTTRDDFVSAKKMTGKKFSITAFDAHTAIKDYTTTITFKVKDPSPSVTKELIITLNIIVDQTGIAPDSEVEFKVKSVKDSTTGTSVSTMKIVSDTSGGKSDILFKDANANAKSAVYSFNIYTLSKNGAASITAKELNALAPDEKEKYLIIQANNDAKKGDVNTFKTFNTPLYTEFIWKYINISTLKVTDGGKAIEFTPIMSSKFNNANSVYTPDSFKLYIEINKFVGRVQNESDQYKKSDASFKLYVDNSAPYVIGNTEYNNNVEDGSPFLTFKGYKGSVRNYNVFDATTTTDRALFRDYDVNDKLTVVPSDVKVLKAWTHTSSTDSTLVEKPLTILDSANQDPAVTISNTTPEKDTITFTINRKIIVYDNAGKAINTPVYIDYEVKGKDLAGGTATTTVRVVVQNTEPDFFVADPATLPNNITMTTDSSGTYVLSVYVEKGVPVKVPLDLFYKDADYDSKNNYNQYEHAEFVCTSVSNAEYYYDTITENPATNKKFSKNGVAMFTAQVADKQNSAIIFNALTYNRGDSVDTFLVIKDSNGSQTRTLKIVLITENTAPEAVNKDNINIYIQGSDTASEGLDGYLEPQYYSIFNLATDINSATDEVDFKKSSSLTYIRFTSKFETGEGKFEVPGDEGVSSRLIEVGTEDPQTLSITPTLKGYGWQKMTIYIADGETNISSNPDRAKIIAVNVTIIVVRDSKVLTPSEVPIQFMHTNVIDSSKLFTVTEKDEDGKDVAINKGNGLQVLKMTLVSGSVEVIHTPLETKNASSDPTYSTGTWAIKGLSETGTAKVSVEIGVIGKSGIDSTKEITIVNKMNTAPVLTSKYNTKNNVFENTFDTGTSVIIPVDKLLSDDPEDKVRILRAESKKTVVCDTTVDQDNNQLYINFKGKGSSKITVYFTDLSGKEYKESFVVENANLPPLNFFARIVGEVQNNPWMYLIILVAVILLLVIILLIIAARRKKRRIREEIEALLVSEMELEEQMLRLAASPSPTFYQSYGYLSPTQNVQNNPQFMLGEAHTNSNTMNNNSNVIGLNAGTSSPTTNPVNSIPDIEDYGDDDL